MEQAIIKLEAVLSAATNPAVLLSFGKDSLLLMAMARQLRPDIPAIWFQDGTTDRTFAMQVIRDWNITVYSWQPANVYTVANGEQTAMISEYSVNGVLLPLVTDVVEGDGVCLRTVQRTPSLFLPFDLLLTGYKDCDTHWLADGTALFPEGMVAGGARLVAPLRHLTDEQVVDELGKRGLAVQQSADEIVVCGDCLTGTPLHWDRPLDLAAFKARTRI